MGNHRSQSSRNCRASLLCTVVAGLVASPLLAQYSDTGTVTGHVYCADTQKPARFANVRLQLVDAQGGRFGGRGGFATTGSDGFFRMTGVSPGDYYADVMMPGYVQPLRGMLRDLQNLTPADRDRINAQLTRVSVAANQAANVQVMIYRGATISGTVSFDDGAPAAGVSIQAFVLATSTTGTQTTGTAPQQSFAGFAQTDDRGQFRVTGLADGTYVVFAAPHSIFPVYYGNTIEHSKAKKLDIHAGDEVPGSDIQVPAAGMHSVSGVVVSQDGHALARASVQLQLSSGDTGTISATTGSDGTFTFNAVPDGKFTVQLSNAYDPSTRVGYTSAGQPLEVNGTDISDLVVNAAPQN
jgi:Carboxypeptidase regulatory-like domain